MKQRLLSTEPAYATGRREGFKKYSQMKLQMKPEALEKLNRRVHSGRVKSRV